MEIVQVHKNGRSLYLKLGPTVRENLGIIAGDWMVVRVVGGRLDAVKLDPGAGIVKKGTDHAEAKAAAKLRRKTA